VTRDIGVRHLGHRESRKESFELASSEVARERDREFGVSAHRVSEVETLSVGGRESRSGDRAEVPIAAEEGQR
jgi:hypothetical protein